MSDPAATTRRFPPALDFLLWTAAFGLAYTQAPLYYSNQNQYFLHGEAWSCFGNSLHRDWLANTADPTPLFSAIVAASAGMFQVFAFHLYQMLLLGLYFHSMVVIIDVLFAPGRLARLLFAAMFFLSHAAVPRLLSAQLFGVDYPVYLQSGVAAQYLLRFGLQPSVAGVFLVAALARFLRDRPLQAAAVLCLAPAFHPTYLLPAALFTAGFLAVLARERRWRDALRTGGLALLLALPVVVDAAVRFGPTDPQTFAEAQRLLARFRIPHHTDPRRWFDIVAGLQLAWAALGLVVIRRYRLFLALLVPAALSLLLSLVQLWINNDTLALLFPWRVSVVLVPLATAVVLGAAASRAGPWLERRATVTTAACWAIIAALIAGGVAITALGLGYRTNPAEQPLLDWVQRFRSTDDLFLLPVNVPTPKPGQRPGAVATDFTAQQVAPDLQSFRLYTGAPIYVDFKSVPYKDVDVLEWKRRLDWAQRMYADRAWDARIDEVRARGITHVVTPAGRAIESSWYELVYEDAVYRLYRVRPPESG